jgi:hypothetical protein
VLLITGAFYLYHSLLSFGISLRLGLGHFELHCFFEFAQDKGAFFGRKAWTSTKESFASDDTPKETSIWLRSWNFAFKRTRIHMAGWLAGSLNGWWLDHIIGGNCDLLCCSSRVIYL